MLYRMEPPEVRLLRLELVRRGLRLRDLAQLVGLEFGTIRTQICWGIPGPFLRWRIEKALQTPFWHSPEQFRRRMRLVRKCGFDPYLSRMADLRQYAT